MLNSSLRFLAFFSALALGLAAARATAAEPNRTTLKFYGQSAFQITTPKGKEIFIDPWLHNPLNPDAQNGADPLAKIARADYILLTHGHFDHIGDATALGKKTKARLVATFELGQNMARAMGYPANQMGFDTLGNAGGELLIADGEVTVAFVQAVHSSGLDADPAGQKPMLYGGSPVGFVVKVKNGPTFYHSGDTAYFKDMETIGETYGPLIALINIGGHFGMEPAMAAKAAKAVRAKLAIPHHYKTFPIVAQSAAGFFADLDKEKIAHREMQPGSTLVFEGDHLK